MNGKVRALMDKKKGRVMAAKAKISPRRKNREQERVDVASRVLGNI
jgi:hypothetical protein